MANPGQGPAGCAPNLFSDQNIFGRSAPPLFQGLDDRPPPLIVRSGSGTVDRILMIPYKRGSSFVL